MCDTILASATSSAAGGMLFGKNSDRQRNEAQAVEVFPRASYPTNALLNCTYITIPQARVTNAVMLCRPFWMWGAEMGANEHGVVIGNEGLRARAPEPRENALTGMDLLRLALERACSAAEAVLVITSSLERHGQGGNCGHLIPSYYHNGFMIADPREAFVLETVDREWMVEAVQDVRAISNEYSIRRDLRFKSPGLLSLVRDAGWWTPVEEPSYADVLTDPARQHIGTAAARWARTTDQLNAQRGQLDLKEMKEILRDHGLRDGRFSEWRKECAIDQSVCMHAGSSDRPAQTVGSMVSEIYKDGGVHWLLVLPRLVFRFSSRSLSMFRFPCMVLVRQAEVSLSRCGGNTSCSIVPRCSPTLDTFWSKSGRSGTLWRRSFGSRWSWLGMEALRSALK